MSESIFKRFGGTITPGCDQLLLEPRTLPDNALCFSHGRAAMIWIIHNAGKFDSAAVCAYTWPEIPNMMRRYNCEVGTFDFMQENILDLIQRLPGRCLVIIPIFYGFDPWIDYMSIAEKLEGKAFVLLDGAQTAFGYEDYPVPKFGAVLSCPHKATSINDGAILLMDEIEDFDKLNYKSLDTGDQFSLIKKNGRKLLASQNEKEELKGLELVVQLEETWPSDPPQRMTLKSYNELSYIDASSHYFARKQNYDYLKGRLESYFLQLPEKLNMRVPFAYAVLMKNRKILIEKLTMKRVFATSLWHNAIYDEEIHPNAADLASNLIAFPIDQRYDIGDMDELADIVISCLKHDS
jgi:hypothetical protein